MRHAVRARVAAMPWPVKFLLAYLAGIIIIGKGPTYLGVPPVYWGEIVMLTSLIWIAPGRRLLKSEVTKHGTLSILISLWLLIGFCWTIISFPRWGLDAFRDAAVWYYAAFYFVGLSLGLEDALADRVWRALRIFWVLSMFWGAAHLASGGALGNMGPMLPWRGVTLFFNARDDSAQNLAMGALIVLCTAPLWKDPIVRGFLMCSAVVGLGLFASSEGRAVKIALATSLVFVLLLSFGRRPDIRFSSRLRNLFLAGIPVVILAVLFVPNFAKKTQLDRFSEAMVATQQTGKSDTGDRTAYWRWVWWRNLVDQVMTRNPAFGIGFGESLHLYHPALESILYTEWIARAPHNINVTVFTRMGFVGLGIWAMILITGFGTLFLRAWRGRVDGAAYSPDRREEIVFWMMMLICSYVNSSFGVLMEGPVFGILFWFGLGFAIARSQRTGQSAAPALAGVGRTVNQSAGTRVAYPRWRQRGAAQRLGYEGF
jgi:hypothetical protein